MMPILASVQRHGEQPDPVYDVGLAVIVLTDQYGHISAGPETRNCRAAPLHDVSLTGSTDSDVFSYVALGIFHSSVQALVQFDPQQA